MRVASTPAPTRVRVPPARDHVALVDGGSATGSTLEEGHASLEALTLAALRAGQ